MRGVRRAGWGQPPLSTTFLHIAVIHLLESYASRKWKKSGFSAKFQEMPPSPQFLGEAEEERPSPKHP
jgi:hypothetical protein|tara:strand:+ start:37178 stop:37381 length:204 start_codon:yes stop_codon:yes gene_type:complete